MWGQEAVHLFHASLFNTLLRTSHTCIPPGGGGADLNSLARETEDTPHLSGPLLRRNGLPHRMDLSGITCTRLIVSMGHNDNTGRVPPARMFAE